MLPSFFYRTTTVLLVYAYKTSRRRLDLMRRIFFLICIRYKTLASFCTSELHVCSERQIQHQLRMAIHYRPARYHILPNETLCDSAPP